MTGLWVGFGQFKIKYYWDEMKFNIGVNSKSYDLFKFSAVYWYNSEMSAWEDDNSPLIQKRQRDDMETKSIL